MKNEFKISKGSIIFYLASVIFLGIGAFYFYVTYQSVAMYSQQQSLQMLDVLNAYFSNCAPFFAYAFGCYGIGYIIMKQNRLIQVLADCMDDEVSKVDVETVVENDEIEG